jgi:hypothetical protein
MRTLRKTLPLIAGFALSGLFMSLFDMGNIGIFISLSVGAYIANLTNSRTTR